MVKPNKYLSENGFLFVILLAVTLYFQHAWVPGFFQDGYLYSAFGKHAADGGHWLLPHLSDTTYSYFPIHPPFIFMLEGLFFKLFGSGYTAARIFSGLFTLLSLLALLKFVSKHGDEKWAYLSGLIFVIMPPLIKKTRFPSLDGPLMLFVFLALIYYYEAFKENKTRSWFLCGLFFGLALLTKGPVGGLVPLGIILHLLATKSFGKLLNPAPWFGLFFGFILFSLWPLALYLADRLDVFEIYFNATFIDTMVGGRGVTKFNYFDYVLFFLKQTAPWFLLALYSIKLFLKKRENSLQFFGIVIFFSFLTLLSIPKFKYSNYLLPLYPFYALIVGYALKSVIKVAWFEKIQRTIKYLFMAITLVLLIFPLTNVSNRHPTLLKALEITKGLKRQPDVWVSIDYPYPFFGLVNRIGYEIDGEVVNEGLSWMISFLKGEKELKFKSETPVKWDEKEFIFLLSLANFEKIKDLLGGRFRPIIHFRKKNLILIVRKENIHSTGLNY